MESKVGFLGGMDRDSSLSKRNPNKYYDALNIRVLTDDGLSTGSVINEKGNSLLFKLPTTLPATSDVSETSDFKIIGLGIMRDWIIVFTTDINLVHTIGNGQIWKCKYNKVTGLIDNTTVGKVLDPAIHLVYNNVLNFNKDYRIGEIISRYQDSTHGKIFFIDGLNTMKHINVLDPNSLTLPLSAIDVVPDVTFSQPKITKVQMGGSLKSGAIQYSYQLFNQGGAETSFAPASGIVHLTNTDEYEPTTVNYKGQPNDSVAGKSVIVSIDNIDTTFDYIRLISVYYTSLEGAPEINIVSEKPVPPTGSIEFTDTGNPIGVYSTIEYNSLGTRLFIPGTITTKNNYLVAANIKEQYFDLDEVLPDWDARAYRWCGDFFEFPILGGNVFKVDGGTYNDYSLINREADCIVTRSEQEVYKYTEDPPFLGGSGVNIKYEFVLTPIKIDNDTDDAKIFTGLASGNQDWSGILGTSFIDNDSYTSYASPLNREQLVGYFRDEIYRFAIVVNDTKGRSSFAKWIGDIKMPSVKDVEPSKVTYKVKKLLAGYDENYDYNLTFRQKYIGEGINGEILPPGIYANVLGVKFTVNNLTLPTGYTYRIVRVRREEADKFILGQGLLGVAEKVNTTEVQPKNHVGMESVVYNNRVSDYNDTGTNHNTIIFFKSPEVLFNNSIKPVLGDKVLPIAVTNTVIYSDNGESSGDTRVYTTKIKTYTPTASSSAGEVEDGIKAIDTYYSDDTSRYVVNNDNGGARNSVIYHNNGNIGSSLVIGLNTPLTIDVDSSHHAILNYTKNDNFIQYGGWGYYNRFNNVYIACGNLKDVTDTTSLVYGGDTFISMWEYINTMFWTSHDPGTATPQERMEVVYIPLESTINTEIKHGSSFSKGSANYKLCETVALGNIYYPGNGYGVYPANYEDVYQYNSAYSAEPIGKTYTVKPQFFANNQVNDYRVIVSEKHINNQLTDSWTKFLYNNMIEVNSAYGPITKIITFRNRLFFFQDNAFGVLGFEDRELLKDNTGLPLVLGTGGILTNFQYISEKTGTKSKFGVIDTGSSLYFIDINNRKFMKFDGNTDKCVSDENSMSSYFRAYDYGNIMLSDNGTTQGIHGVFDPINKRVLYTLLGTTPETFSFNEVLDGFESFYSFKPTIYENTDFGVISINPSALEECYLHTSGYRGVFYGTAYDSYITHILAPNPDNKKVFNNLEFNSYVEVAGVDSHDKTINSIELWNSFQDTGVITLTEPTNIRRRFRTWRYQIPKVSSLRMMDYSLFTKLSFTNSISEDTYFRLDDITIHYLVPML